MSAQAAPPLAVLQATLVPESPSPSTLAPIAKRMRATYWLRHLYQNDLAPKPQVLHILQSALNLKPHGSLLRHEVAYVLGQLRDPAAGEALETLLRDQSEDPMLRHECGEALGAIGCGLAVLEQVASAYGEDEEVRQTCEIARDFILWKRRGAQGPVMACACMLSPFNSFDPAPPDEAHEKLSTEELGELLLCPRVSLFERYRAMFSLRNRKEDGAVRALGRALVEDESSSLLRHEVAFVLGQMESPQALPFLERSLRRKEESKIVRHESAEALGALYGCGDKAEKLLREFMQDEDVVVAESCVVALDAADYFGKSLSCQSTQSFTQLKGH